MKHYYTPELTMILQFEQDVIRTSGGGTGGVEQTPFGEGENFIVDTLGF